MRKIIFLFIVILVCNACTESKETPFERNGVHFVCPKGWKVTEVDSLENGGFYLSVEKDGLSSGLMTMSWLPWEYPLEEWLDIHRREMEENIIYKNSNLEFEAISAGKFANLTTTALRFKASILGIKHRGIINVFHEKGRTFSVLKQEALEDKTANAGGYQFLEKTFQVKSSAPILLDEELLLE